ncbi:MAG TPA: EAL domain-containing protein, partial [Rhodanobacter sp.]|nr:EAL domain-containing protein [Rhodanobacter sp.]
CNERVLQGLHRRRDEIVGHTDLELFGPGRAAEIRELDARTTREGRRQTGLLALGDGADDQRQLQIINAPLRDEAGHIYGTLGTGRDVTDEARTEAELRLAAAAFQIQEALLVLDGTHCIRRVNQAFEALTGFAAADVVGKDASFLRSGHHDPAFFTQLWARVETEGYWQDEYWVRVKHGRPRVVRMAISAVHGDGGAVTHYLASMVDLTAEREAHASVDHMTFFDPLTDLPNRHYLHGRLRQVLDDPDAAGDALLILDLDHFKRVNDLRGHAAGDWLLTQVAQRLRRALDADGMLSRFGGGTFAVLQGGVAPGARSAAETAQRCAEHLRQVLHAPFPLGNGAPVTVTASIGWTVLVPGAGTPDSVLKEAELAMYEAKASGRDQARGYTPAMQAQLERNEALVHDLRTAIADDTLALHLQAQTDRDGCIVGAEGLLRWTRPCGEQVPPGVFIPLAEENGLIVVLGNWVLQRACELLAQWAGAPATRDLALAVNVSARQFARPDFVDTVRAVVATHGVDPSRLKLEVTESAILDDLDEATAKLRQLRALGMRISLDDFGTGYSSLAYLSRLPLDQLKIDQSFVARLPDSPSDAMVARTIIGMGRGLGMEVIAEGVETSAQHAFLMSKGCNAFQGFLISMPVSAPAFEALLARQPVVTSPAGN